MFDCNRCGSTGRVPEQYYDPLPMTEPPDGGIAVNAEVEIKTRMAECPECLGFSAIPLRPSGSP